MVWRHVKKGKGTTRKIYAKYTGAGKETQKKMT